MKHTLLIHLTISIFIVLCIQNLLAQSVNRPIGDVYGNYERTLNSTHFKVHYTKVGNHITTQQFAENIRSIAEQSWQDIADELQWNMPPTDNEVGGGNDLYDIYIADMNLTPNYSPPASTVSQFIPGVDYGDYNGESSYIIIHNQDLDMIADLNPNQERQLVILHELHHGCQYGYRKPDDPDNDSAQWFRENTSVYIENLVYMDAFETTDPLQIRFQFAPEDPLDSPHLPINYYTSQYYAYAGGLWPAFLHGKYGNSIVKQIWHLFGINSDYTVLQAADIALQGYGTDLKKAMVDYAIWRYFTGNRDDGYHYNNAGDWDPAVIYDTHNTGGQWSSTSPTPSGPGGAQYIEFEMNDDFIHGIDFAFDGEDGNAWGAGLIGYKSNGSFETRIFLSGEDHGTYDLTNDDYSKVVLIPVVTEWENSVNNRDYEYQADYQRIIGVHVTQKNSQDQTTGTIYHWENEEEWKPYSQLPVPFTWEENTTQSLKATTTPINNEKFLYWKFLTDQKLYLTHNPIEITEEYNNDVITSQFRNFTTATLKTVCGASEINGFIEFKDPWVLDDLDGDKGEINRSMDNALYYSYTTPVTIDGSTIHSGIFEEIDYDLSPSYYMIKTELLFVSQDGIYLFSHWDSGNNAAQFSDPNALETKVTFTDPDAVVRANYTAVNLIANYELNLNEDELLTVPAGATIPCAAGFKIISSGKIEMTGTPDDPIVFTRNNEPIPAEDDRFLILSDPPTSSDNWSQPWINFEYVRFENFIKGDPKDNDPVIEFTASGPKPIGDPPDSYIEKGATLFMRNCVFSNCDWSVHLNGEGGDDQFCNCTFYHAPVVNSTSPAAFINCIFYEEGDNLAISGQIDRCIFFQVANAGYLSTLGSNNMITNPLFTNPASGDYTLQYNSPAIDSGQPYLYLWNNTWIDQDPDGSTLDRGAYYYQDVTPPLAPINFDYEDDNNRPKFTWDANTEPDLKEYEVWRYRTFEFHLGYVKMATVTNNYWTDTSVGLEDPAESFKYKVLAVDLSDNKSDFSNIITVFGYELEKPIAGHRNEIPTTFGLEQNYPNPFNPSTIFRYSLPVASMVDLKIYTINGQLIKSFFLSSQPAGYQQYTWNGENANGNPVPSGIYIIQFKAEPLDGKEKSYEKYIKATMLK